MRPTLATLSAAALLASCATPQIALDQANNGVALTRQLQVELQRYKVNAGLAAERRLEVVRRQETQSVRSTQRQSTFDYLNAQTGFEDGSPSSAAVLRGASAKYSESMAAIAAADKEIAERLSAVVKDLPTSAAKVSAVQKAMAELGTELSSAERLAIVAKFARDSKKIVDQNVKAAAGAASAAASAPGP